MIARAEKSFMGLSGVERIPPRGRGTPPPLAPPQILGVEPWLIDHRSHPRHRRPSDRQARVAGQITAGCRPRVGTRGRHAHPGSPVCGRVPVPHPPARLVTLDPSGARGQRAHPEVLGLGARQRCHGWGAPRSRGGILSTPLSPMKDFSPRDPRCPGFRARGFGRVMPCAPTAAPTARPMPASTPPASVGPSRGTALSTAGPESACDIGVGGPACPSSRTTDLPRRHHPRSHPASRIPHHRNHRSLPSSLSSAPIWTPWCPRTRRVTASSPWPRS
jgi:hypothetical protein